MNTKEMILVLDTETCDLSGSVYDVGYTIADKKGNISITRNWLVAEVFTDAKRMMGAFYAKKMFTHYARMLNDGEVKLAAWSDIVEAIQTDCEAYKVTTVAAYNAGFDFRVMGNTHTGKILPQGVKMLDLWQFACETKLSQKAYKKMALENNWVSPAGNIKTGAEFAYRYTTQRPEFIEDHTALSDALIETQIMAACFAQKKRVPYGIINAQPWRIVNKKPVENDPDLHGAKTA
jgi:hypothetical protein